MYDVIAMVGLCVIVAMFAIRITFVLLVLLAVFGLLVRFAMCWYDFSVCYACDGLL